MFLVLAQPHLGFRRELRLGWERAAQFTIVAIKIEARPERGDHELRELSNPVGESTFVAGLRRIATSDCLEVLWGAPRVSPIFGRSQVWKSLRGRQYCDVSAAGSRSRIALF